LYRSELKKRLVTWFASRANTISRGDAETLCSSLRELPEPITWNTIKWPLKLDIVSFLDHHYEFYSVREANFSASPDLCGSARNGICSRSEPGPESFTKKFYNELGSNHDGIFREEFEFC